MSFTKNENKINYLNECLGSLRKIRVSSQNKPDDDLEEILKVKENKTDCPFITNSNHEDDQKCILPEFCSLKEILQLTNEFSHLYSENDTIIYSTKSKVKINEKYVSYSESKERNFTVKIKFITFENKLSVLLILEDCTYVEIISELH